MAKGLVVSVLAISIAVEADPSFGQPISSVPAPKIVSIDGLHLYRARKVLKGFYESDPGPECYDVLFSLFEGNLRVDFVPKGPPRAMFKDEPEYVGPNVCGRNIGYVIDKNGNTLRKIRSK